MKSAIVFKLLDKYIVYIYAGLAVSLPFSLLINNICIGILIVNWGGNYARHVKWRDLVQFPLILFILFYCFHVIALFYSNDFSAGLSDLEKKMALIILPVVVLTGFKPAKKQVRFILNSFVLTCFLALIICFLNALIVYSESNINSEIFFYDRLSSILGLHPVYFSLYIAFSAFCILDNLKNKSWRANRLQIIIYGVILLVLVIGLFLLSARIVIVGFFISAILSLAYQFKLNKKMLASIGFFLGLGFIIILNNVDFVKSRFLEIKDVDVRHIMNSDEFGQHYLFTGERRRILNFRISIELLKDKKTALMGLGTGAGFEYLNDRIDYYRRNSYVKGQGGTKFNFHNQYLETLSDLGLVGLILLLLCYFYYVVKISKRDNFLYFIFVILFAVMSLTESNLEVNKGIIFFCFFSVILLQGRLDSSQEIETIK